MTAWPALDAIDMRTLSARLAEHGPVDVDDVRHRCDVSGIDVEHMTLAALLRVHAEDVPALVDDQEVATYLIAVAGIVGTLSATAGAAVAAPPPAEPVPAGTFSIDDELPSLIPTWLYRLAVDTAPHCHGGALHHRAPSLGGSAKGRYTPARRTIELDLAHHGVGWCLAHELAHALDNRAVDGWLHRCEHFADELRFLMWTHRPESFADLEPLIVDAHLVADAAVVDRPSLPSLPWEGLSWFLDLELGDGGPGAEVPQVTPAEDPAREISSPDGPKKRKDEVPRGT